LSLDDEVNALRTTFVAYSRYGQTHLIFELHTKTANKLSAEQYRRVMNLLDALNSFEEAATSSDQTPGRDPRWTVVNRVSGGLIKPPIDD
jgi:hypothetical protein